MTLNLTENAKTVLKARYLQKNLQGEITETFEELFHRVAKTVAMAETRYGNLDKMEEYEEKFYNLMTNLKFLPNSPTLMNAGTEEGQLSACFVIPVGDSMKEIFEAVKYAALIQKSGGGVGYSFSRLRPAGDRVKTTKGVSSGPISFMKVFNEATETVKQGGKRRGANMGVLRVDHPDILDFIEAKSIEGEFYNFNISVGITDKFMEALESGGEYALINPRSGEKVESLKAREVWNKIIRNAWDKGDPGLLFIDRINENNPTPSIGSIESTNPCGEACLLPFEACNLGSINLSKFVKNNSIDYNELKKTVHLAVRFLDNVIDVNEYVPSIPQIKKMTKCNRKIGLGIMGFADLLIDLGISYNDEKARKVGDSVMSFISREAKKASSRLARERGSFPNWDKSTFAPKTPMRNACVTSIAPTGTLSIIAGCSPGIEPLFGVCFERNVLDGEKLLEVNPRFEKIARKRGFYSEELIRRMAGAGTIQNFNAVPDDVKELFVTAHDIPPKNHVLMQAAFQNHVDMSVSKTINLPHKATMEEVGEVYLLSYRSGCKGNTVFRDGCRTMQVITMGKKDSQLGQADDFEVIKNNYDTREIPQAELDQLKIMPLPVTVRKGKNGSNGKNGKNGKSENEEEMFKIPTFFSNSKPCPECGEGTIITGACSVCHHCGYSKCG
ncbi:MAG: adenosylcobalamin-dependent ribonucleoside-diphosphate reductase [Vulcanimicrobiota bacterium]